MDPVLKFSNKNPSNRDPLDPHLDLLVGFDTTAASIPRAPLLWHCREPAVPVSSCLTVLLGSFFWPPVQPFLPHAHRGQTPFLAPTMPAPVLTDPSKGCFKTQLKPRLPLPATVSSLPLTPARLALAPSTPCLHGVGQPRLLGVMVGMRGLEGQTV